MNHLRDETNVSFKCDLMGQLVAVNKGRRDGYK